MRIESKTSSNEKASKLTKRKSPKDATTLPYNNIHISTNFYQQTNVKPQLILIHHSMPAHSEKKPIDDEKWEFSIKNMSFTTLSSTFQGSRLHSMCMLVVLRDKQRIINDLLDHQLSSRPSSFLPQDSLFALLAGSTGSPGEHGLPGGSTGEEFLWFHGCRMTWCISMVNNKALCMLRCRD